ncbi:MAG: hypothetical protein JWN79_1928, partial [Gemmatimonadetes bacterium]|nr:hypothetical protein [Gemmatimonadota bacterium]
MLPRSLALVLLAALPLGAQDSTRARSVLPPVRVTATREGP